MIGAHQRLAAAALGAGVTAMAGHAIAAPLVVVEARGGGVRPGMKIDSGAPIQLKEGEKVVLIATDGRATTLRGPYRGPAGQARSGGTQNATVALAALISTRRDRASAVGAVRSGASAAALPEPWLIDISRPGERCLREGDMPRWWRPSGAGSQPFTVYPVDRSWKADFVWKDGSDTMSAPELGKLDTTKSYNVKVAEQEYAIRLNIIPRDLTDPFVVTSWMLQKACFQQADAYLRIIERELPPPAGGDAGAAPSSSETAS